MKASKILLPVSIITFLFFGLFYYPIINKKINTHFYWYGAFNKTGYNDILILGNSRVGYNIDPNIVDSLTHLRSYMIQGTGDMTDAYLFLKKYLQNHQKPKILLVNIDDWLFDYDSNLSEDRRQIYVPALFDTLIYNELKKHHFSIRHQLIHRTFLGFYDLKYAMSQKDQNKIRSLLVQYFYDIPTKEDSVKVPIEHKMRGYNGGITREWNSDIDKFVANMNEANLVKKDIDFDVVEARTNQVIDVCRKNNIKLMFMHAPMYQKAMKDNNVFTTQFANYSIKKNVPFFDFCKNDTIFTKRRFFCDPIHLHRRGSIIYSKKIAELINTELEK